MCSFAGKILPRPPDNQLRYVSGDTRIVSIHRHTTFSTLLFKLSKVSGNYIHKPILRITVFSLLISCSFLGVLIYSFGFLGFVRTGTTNVWIKYQLPNEDLDALISVTTDEDVENMMEEYDRLTKNHPNPKAVRLRIFLFPKDEHSRANKIASLLHGAENRDTWFFDALNSGGVPSSVLERLHSDTSSIFSEVPDHFFGFDINSDEPKLKTQPLLQQTETLAGPDPVSAVRNESFTFSSMSSVPTLPLMPNLKPVKTKPDKPAPFFEKQKNFPETVETPAKQAVEYSPCSTFMHSPCSPFMHNVSDPQYLDHVVQAIPVYYVSGPAQPVQIRAQYVQPYPAGMCPISMVYPGWVPTMDQVCNAPLMPVMAQDGMEQ